jgi:hypothetical protein
VIKFPQYASAFVESGTSSMVRKNRHRGMKISASWYEKTGINAALLHFYVVFQSRKHAIDARGGPRCGIPAAPAPAEINGQRGFFFTRHWAGAG